MCDRGWCHIANTGVSAQGLASRHAGVHPHVSAALCASHRTEQMSLAFSISWRSCSAAHVAPVTDCSASATPRVSGVLTFNMMALTLGPADAPTNKHKHQQVLRMFCRVITADKHAASFHKGLGPALDHCTCTLMSAHRSSSQATSLLGMPHQQSQRHNTTVQSRLHTHMPTTAHLVSNSGSPQVLPSAGQAQGPLLECQR